MLPKKAFMSSAKRRSDLRFMLITFSIAVLFWRQNGVGKDLGTNEQFFILNSHNEFEYLSDEQNINEKNL